MSSPLIRKDKLILKGSPLTGSTGPFATENPQPFFKQPDLSVEGGPGFPEDKKYNYGLATGFCVLPYTMQDRYNRELVDMEFPSLVLENDFLRAEFIPALGGRLWSLFDKQNKRDILYRNPLFRPANLAIRDAWFSGGIEWNFGRYGHTVHTCSPVFAGIIEESSSSILRLWEFERQTRLFWRIDFSLPENSAVLYVYTRIENPDNKAKPLYWWTNAAIPQTKGVRVFSATDEVIYIVPGLAPEMPGNEKPGVKMMDYGRLPDLPVLPGRDASYPALSDYSNEYFYQNDRSAGKNLPWEAAVYEDGYSYGEISTPPLLYRKMFCWGSGRGGRRWQDFLSQPGQEYLEVQAGLAPTQLHAADISGGETVDWVQAFTAFHSEPELAFQKDYQSATSYVADRLRGNVPSTEINAALEQGRQRSCKEATILFTGSGWGAVEELLHKQPGPPGLLFPKESIGKEEAPWAELLRSGALPLKSPEEGSGSFAVDDTWEKFLEESPDSEGDWLTPYHLGVISFEKGESEKAALHWKKSLEKAENPWACRNLALIAVKAGDRQAALDYYKRALSIPVSGKLSMGVQGKAQWDQSFAEEYIPLLLEAGKLDEAEKELEIFTQQAGSQDGSQAVSIEALSTPLLEAAARLALNRRDDALLDRIFSIEQPHLREGKNTMLEIWAERELKRGNPLDDSNLPPKEINFKMY